MNQEVNEAITLLSQIKEDLITLQELHDTALVDNALYKIDKALDKLTIQNVSHGT